VSDSPSPVSASDVEDAAERLVGVVETTPLHRNQRLSAAHGCEVLLKREDLQSVRSYKVRGAHNLILQLDDQARARGVVCASAGNHAQGFALACASLGVDGTVFVPTTTPRQKRERIAVLGGDRITLRVQGDTYDEASGAAKAHAAETGATLVHAFDDARTVAGQGTVVAEAFEQLGRVPAAVVLPVGGGGLIAGAVAWLRERHPEVQIVGVEPDGAACLAAAHEAGRPMTLEEIDTFVDGAAVRRAGQVPYDVLAGADLTLVTVPEGRVCQEMLELYQSDGIIAEPAGALATAALGHAWVPEPGSEVLCILSGGNNDVSRYADILERALVFEGRKHYFLVDFPQEPGALRSFLDDVLGPDDDITLFEYVKRSNRETGPALVGIELGNPDDLVGLLARMEAAPPRIERVSPDSPLFGFIL
jgi:threonine dehydratase